MKFRSWKKSLQLLFVIFCAFPLMQCGSTDSIVEAECVSSFLTGGSYSFTVTTVSDQCAGGVLAGLVPSGPYVMDLPAFAELPASTELDFPVVGTVTVDLALSETDNTVSIVTDPPETSGTIDYPGGALDYTAVVTGVLCPTAPSTANVSLQVNITSLTPEFFAVPCTVVLVLTGGL